MRNHPEDLPEFDLNGQPAFKLATDLPTFDLGINWCERCGFLPATHVITTSRGEELACGNPECEDGTLALRCEGGAA